jgi:hypothetical protein
MFGLAAIADVDRGQDVQLHVEIDLPAVRVTIPSA